MAALVCGAGLYLVLVSHVRTPGYAVKNLGVFKEFVPCIAAALLELTRKGEKIIQQFVVA